MGLAERWEGTKRSRLSQSGEGLLNWGGGWKSATFTAVKRGAGDGDEEVPTSVNGGGRGAGSPGQGVLVGSRR